MHYRGSAGNAIANAKPSGLIKRRCCSSRGPLRTWVCFAFPANVNVAGTLSLAGIGYEDTVVRVIADPGIARNVHQIEVKGEFGVLTVRTENLPSPVNPKTSYIAVLSAIATLRKLTEPVWVGT